MNIKELFKDLQKQLQERQDITQPYLYNLRLEKKYNPDYEDITGCRCGHSYDRHFDSYENMDACGCKYCNCDEFIEETRDNFTIILDWLEKNNSDFIIENDRILASLIYDQDKKRLNTDIVDITEWKLDKIKSYLEKY